jgi:hypothetical protein
MYILEPMALTPPPQVTELYMNIKDIDYLTEDAMKARRTINSTYGTTLSFIGFTISTESSSDHRPFIL